MCPGVFFLLCLFVWSRVVEKKTCAHNEKYNRLGVGAFRCLALAQGEVSTSANLDDASQFEKLEQGMTFVGFFVPIVFFEIGLIT